MSEPTTYITREAVAGTLFYRILDDTRYTEKRLGRVPSDDEVRAAIEKHASNGLDTVAIALDSIESDVWYELENANGD